jgi:hypothetical protein
MLLDGQDPPRFHDPSVDRVARGLGELQGECHVLPHGHMRVQRIVLEDHREVPVLRFALVHDLVPDLERAFRDVLQSGDHSQGGGLARARRANQHHELSIIDVEVHILDGFEAVAVALCDVLKDDVGHGPAP